MEIQVTFSLLIFLVVFSRSYCFGKSGGDYLYLPSTSFPVLVISNDDTPGEELESSLVLADDIPGNEDSVSTSGNMDDLAGVSAEPPRTSRTPIRESLYVVIPMTIIYSLIFIIGLVGNISTCIVIARTRFLHTATNYYLFSLSISDLLLLLSGLPQEMYSIWVRYPYIFGEAFCVIRGLAAETSANATVLTITAFTVERYVAICHPLRSHKLSQLSRVVRTIISIWIVALALALPQAARFGLIDEIEDEVVVVTGAWCSIKREFIPYAFEISICVFFVIPMTIITVLYILIGMKLRKSRRGPSNVNQELTVEPYRYAQTRHSQTHVIRMLVSVVVAFFVCWAPFHCQRLLAIYAQGTKSRTLVAIYDMITHASGILYYLSTCINPVLYNIMSNKFRQAFKDTWSTICVKRHHTRGIHTRTYSVASNRSSRMGAILQNNQLGQSLRHHQETCLNCRHTPSMCACRGSSGKFVRKYTQPMNTESPGLAGSLSASPYGNNSPLDVTIPLTAIRRNNDSQGRASKRQLNLRSEKPSGGRGLSTFCITRKQGRMLDLIGRKRAPSDPIGPDILDTSPPKMGRYYDAGGPSSGDSTTGRKTSQLEVNRSSCGSSTISSNSENSISNSSLQDLDRDEYTGEELANCLAEMKEMVHLPWSQKPSQV